MDKSYEPQALEARWYQFWEQRGYFAPHGEGAPFCIVIPPPNVTGTLHMGHAFQDTLMDGLIRLQRMRGAYTLWQPGTDHAGIATQMVVERQLAAQGKSRFDLGREAFVGRVWEWKAESGGTITRQLRRMGASLDWSRERFTMDDVCSRAVREAFVRLYREGLLYRGQRLVNWDPVLHTAVSDLEVESHEEKGHLWHLRYPITGTDQHLVVATTRPETMLGDTAVAVHPDDERYRHLIGQTISLPLTARVIPIIADDYVDPAFGSGCVKITPAHDFNDYAVGQRHQLPLINVFTIDAKLNDQVPEKYRGLDRYVARKQLIADLDALNLLEKIEPHTLKVPRGDRTNAVIEPYLTDQWFVKAAPLAAPAIQAVKDGRIRFVPDNWDKTYFEWLNNIEDWCISRQIWWGHRIPAWYGPAGEIFVGYNEADVREHYELPADMPLRQDNDVLDTWFSSALWPFATQGWPEQTPSLQAFYPSSVLVTGFDIIFFWVARMVMMGLHFCGDVPFRTVYIHGLVRDADGQKMSKSKGNVLDPLDIIDGIDLETLVKKRTTGLMQPQLAPKIEKATRQQFPDGIRAFGTDALRFTFASLATTGRDVVFDLGRVEGYRNFCNKLWNAARYVLSNVEGHDLTGDIRLTQADEWIVSRLQHTIADTNAAFDQYRFDQAAQAIYEFAWHAFCDWYLELSKPVLTDDAVDPAIQRGTRHTLITVLETLLRLLHPLMPFITEEIWQRVTPLAAHIGRSTGETICRQPYPQADAARIQPDAEAEIEWLKAALLGIRRIRAEMNLNPSRGLSVLLQGGDAVDRQRVTRQQAALLRLGRLDSLTWLAADEPAPEAAMALVGELKWLIPMAGLIDKAAEEARLMREIARLQADIERMDSKLANESFVARAPAEVVEKERERREKTRGEVEQLDAQLAQIRRL